MIKTIEELEALPVGSVIRDARGNVAKRDGQKGYDWHWEFTDANVATNLEVAQYGLPAVQLIPATISRERFEEVSDQWPYRSLRGSTLENFLAAFGIEVSNE